MCTKLSKPLWVTILTTFIALTSGLSTVQDWICWRAGQYNISCDLKCSDGLARPGGCEICECREFLCTKPDAVKCREGSHCEVQRSGNLWYQFDAAICVEDDAEKKSTTETVDKSTMNLALKATQIAITSTTSKTTTPYTTTELASTTKTTASTITTKPTTSKTTAIRTTPRTSTTSRRASTPVSSLGDATEPVPVTCEQKGRCDNWGNCSDPGFVCRSDGRCCKEDSSMPETNSEIPRCQQKPDFGFCVSSFNKYVYDINSSRCVATVFGGCGYSENMFTSKAECHEICERPCLQPPSDGPCRANLPRYYYDWEQHKCLLFDYGGCQGNKNNFRTAEACEIQCGMLHLTDISRYSTHYRSAGKTHVIFPHSRDSNRSSDGSNGSNTTNSGNDIKSDQFNINNIDNNNRNMTHSTANEHTESTTAETTNISKHNTGVNDRPNMMPFVGRAADINSEKSSDISTTTSSPATKKTQTWSDYLKKYFKRP